MNIKFMNSAVEFVQTLNHNKIQRTGFSDTLYITFSAIEDADGNWYVGLSHYEILEENSDLVFGYIEHSAKFKIENPYDSSSWVLYKIYY